MAVKTDWLGRPIKRATKKETDTARRNRGAATKRSSASKKYHAKKK